MKTIYLNLEDDIAKAVKKIKAIKGEEMVLVIPKDSYLLSDSINLRLLKKQVDMMKAQVFILTMDVNGQRYAREAGFGLKRLPKVSKANSISDIRSARPAPKSAPRIAPVAVPSKPRSTPPQVNSAKVHNLRSEGLRPKIRRQVSEDSQSWLAPRSESIRSGGDNLFMPRDNKTNRAPHRRSYKKWLISFVALCLIVVIGLVVVVLPSANVTVLAKEQTVARDLELVIDGNAAQVDASRLTLPATSVDQAKNVSSSFNSKGKKEVGAKAQGQVAIYNLTGSPLNLKATTTALTVGSKTFYFTEDQSNIAALESANNDAAATKANVIASDGGEGYNLPAGTRMEINNQSFGSQPQRLFAKTVTQVIGGSSRFVSVIATEDLSGAQQELINKAVAEINSGLTNGRKLVSGAFTVEIANFVSDKPEGTETTTFNASADITIRGLAFNEEELKTMVRGRLQQTLGSDKTLQPASEDKVVYKIKNYDAATQLMQLSIHYESLAQPVIDSAKLITQLAGKSKEQASDILLTNPDIEQVEITLAPSWQQSFPRIGSKIHLEVVK